MRAKAIAKYARISSRKIGQVLDLIRGKQVDEAMRILPFVTKAAAPIVNKVLKSAVANTGKSKNSDGLRVLEAWANQGPPLKRMRPFAMGRGFMYKRKTCHVTVVVGDA